MAEVNANAAERVRIERRFMGLKIPLTQSGKRERFHFRGFRSQHATVELQIFDDSDARRQHRELLSKSHQQVVHLRHLAFGLGLGNRADGKGVPFSLEQDLAVPAVPLSLKRRHAGTPDAASRQYQPHGCRKNAEVFSSALSQIAVSLSAQDRT